jgi:hypothetical protein
LNCPGPFLFSEPGVLDNWCQTLPGGPTLPLTPPDTDSEPDMCAKWTQASLPEETWYAGPVQDHSTYVQPSSSEWDAQTLFSPTQDYQPLDTFQWNNNTSHGSVGAGLSPVLSNESQSSHALNSFSDAELPPGLDLSFAFEPTWSTAGSMMSQEAPAPQHPLPGNAFVPSLDDLPLAPRMDDALTQWPLDFSGCLPQTTFFTQAGQTARPMARSPALAPQRTLLPRTEGPLTSAAPAFARTSLRGPSPLSLQSHASPRKSSPSVSNNGFAMPGSPRIEAGLHRASSGPVTSGIATVPSAPAMERSHTLPESIALPRTYAQDSNLAITDPAAEEFTAFIQYDQDEQPATGASRSEFSKQFRDARDIDCSYSYTAEVPSSVVVPASRSLQEPARPHQTKVEVDAKPIKVSPKPAAAPLGELDEGRHRTHALYAKGPDADGLFRCPFKATENCPHKATKLKCNYEYESRYTPRFGRTFANHDVLCSKFVDSHLKPFRCRQEACSKQEFSSTACLLRHEREAHGMHGHGDRPHLCFYTGCERGLPGNGFPRRYNLFDHMKRVHDHREENSSAVPSPKTAAVDMSQRKIAGRKRKAPSSTDSPPTAQRQKMSPQVTQQAPGSRTLSLPQDVFQMPVQARSDVYPSEGYPWPAAAPTLSYPIQVSPAQELPRDERYSQWTNQRASMARNFDFIQSQDQSGLALFDRNFHELRRLSDEARHG